MRDPVQYAQSDLAFIRELPALVALFDADMRYVGCSDRWLAAHARDWDEISGRSQYDLFPETSSSWRDAGRSVLGGQVASGKLDYHIGENCCARINWKMLPRRNASGKIIGTAVFGDDGPEKEAAQAACHHLAGEFALLVQSAVHHAVYTIDPSGRVQHWNAGAERLFGWAEEEVLGRDGWFLQQPRDVQGGDLDAGVRAGHYRLIRKDGTIFSANVTTSPVHADDGALVGYGRVVHDVTEAMARERELALHVAQMRTVIETVPDAMVMIDENGIIQSFSPAAEALFGYEAAEACGQNVSMLMPEPDAPRHDGYLMRYHRTGERRIIGHKRRVLGKRKDGTTFPHELYVGEALSDGTKVFTGFLRDLTEREQRESALRELQAELVRISRVTAVGTIATALAHDLNQPLAAVVNYVQASAALLESPATEIATVRAALNEAASEALRAGDIVHKLREFITSGETAKSLVAADDLVGHACELGAAGSRAGAPTIRISVPSALPVVLADPVQIQQVIFNLVRNAVVAVGPKEDGLIELSASVEDGQVRFEMRDNGPGVARERIARLFEPLAGTATGGMGLGLAICRTIIEAHAGRLWHEHAPGGGAVFQFTLPVAEDSDDG